MLSLLVLSSVCLANSAVVKFDSEGVTLVDGKPYFPIGIFTYDLNSHVMADIHDKQFNTILHSFQPEQLDYIHHHGLMAVCYTDEKWFEAARNHPALLAWYLTDEPEGRSLTSESEKERYLALKKRDPNHPIGMCHFLFEALEKYKGCRDFTMTDVYPITWDRDVPIINVGIHIDQSRVVHGSNWPNWTYIQVFGGAETDGGKWAQPLPHEVRCMVFIALVHRSTGILYFSYWPKAPQTWASIGEINRDIYSILPWLLTPGRELAVQCSDEPVQVRARSNDRGGIVLAVNTSPVFRSVEITVPEAKTESLEMPLNGCRKIRMAKGRLTDFFAPFEARVYIWGEQPELQMARWH